MTKEGLSQKLKVFNNEKQEKKISLGKFVQGHRWVQILFKQSKPNGT